MEYSLAIDIGATSGRLVLSHRENGRLCFEIIHRFKTPLVDDGDSHCHWDVDALFKSILKGLKAAKKMHKIPSRIGIDTFGVDYALLDENDRRIGEVVSYRDERTQSAKWSLLSPGKIFEATGIAPQNFDTCYQLYCDKASGKLATAKTIMLLPSYLCYLLTGVKQNELSILSTGALLTPGGTSYSKEVLDAIGIDESLFPDIVSAGTKIGRFLPAIEKAVGYNADVYATLEHDTAAAFLGSGASYGELLLSSGTWSLLGVILPEAIATEEAYRKGFTNELSHPGEVRFLQNIMGMWLINRLMKEKGILAIEGVTSAAERGSSYEPTFDASDNSLLNPPSMEKAILLLLARQGDALPSSDDELFYCVYHSLAKAYVAAIEGIKAITGLEFRSITVFGGGVNAEILNRLTEKESGLEVKRGPSEATAIGNLLCIGA